MTDAARILLVDDDRDIRESLHDALEDRGYAVVDAVDGLDALQQIRDAADLPDIILLDLMMPRMSGAQFRAEMVKDERFKRVPVLVLTADASARSRIEAMNVDGYLVKPVRLRDLYDRVATLLDAARSQAG